MKKLIFVTVLIFILFSSTQVAYSLFQKDNDMILDEKNDVYVIKQNFSNDQNRLIPLNAVLKDNDTYYIEYQYTFEIEPNMQLEAYLNDINLEDFENPNYTLEDIFNITFTIDQLSQSNYPDTNSSTNTDYISYSVTVKVSMNNIDDNSVYSHIYNNKLDFTFVLRVSKP